MASRFFADISNYQDKVDLAEYRHAGHRLIAIKSSEGVGTPDSLFDSHWHHAEQEGLRRIAYHFLRPRTDRRGSAEAKDFLEHVRSHGLHPKRDFLCCDFEVLDNLPGHEAVRYFREFREYLRHNTDAKLITYSYSAFLAALGPFPIDRLWLADYANNLWIPRGFGPAWAWQRTDGAVGRNPRHCAGIGRCDVSLLNRATFLRILL